TTRQAFGIKALQERETRSIKSLTVLGCRPQGLIQEQPEEKKQGINLAGDKPLREKWQHSWKKLSKERLSVKKKVRGCFACWEEIIGMKKPSLKFLPTFLWPVRTVP